MNEKKQEAWLRGPVDGIPPLLQPVAHALIQAREEIAVILEGFADSQLWEKPAGVASPGFHLQHIRGVIDRLLTYARGEMLNTEQLNDLKTEGKAPSPACTAKELLAALNLQVDNALDQMRGTHEAILTEHRGVGRAQLPSTVIGLLMHAAEHTQRHTGQLLVTVRWLNAVRL